MKDSAPVATWIAKRFWSVTDKGALNQAIETLRPSALGMFAGDDLMAFGRAMSFFFDETFMGAFNAQDTDIVEKATIWRKYVLYWAARQALGRPGDFVEAGCFKGTSAKIVCDAVGFAKLPRTYWLYDAFEEVDPTIRMAEHSPELEGFVRQRFSDVLNARVIAGRIPESFNKGEPETVALLHIDMNNEAAETATLERFYERLSPGAVIVLDDYGQNGFRDQKIAADKFAAARGKMILEIPTGQGLLIN